MGQATDDVQTAVDGITTLPEEAEEPEVRRGAWRDRVTDVVITGPVGAGQLGLFADELVVRLCSRPASPAPPSAAWRRRKPLSRCRPPKLITHDITMREIAEAIAAEVDARPRGRCERRQCPRAHRQRKTQTG